MCETIIVSVMNHHVVLSFELGLSDSWTLLLHQADQTHRKLQRTLVFSSSAFRVLRAINLVIINWQEFSQKMGNCRENM